MIRATFFVSFSAAFLATVCGGLILLMAYVFFDPATAEATLWRLLFKRRSKLRWPLVWRRTYDAAVADAECNKRLATRFYDDLRAKCDMLEKEIGPRLDALAKVSEPQRLPNRPHTFRITAHIDEFTMREFCDGSSDAALDYLAQRIGRGAAQAIKNANRWIPDDVRRR